jgi:hypothetical protein
MAQTSKKQLMKYIELLKKSKNIVIDVPNKRSPWFNYLKPMFTGRKHIHDHSYTTKEIKQMLKKSGFKDIESNRILFTPKGTPKILLGFMKWIDLIGEHLPIINEFSGIIVCKAMK